MINILHLESSRKRLLYLICCGLFIPIISGFALMDYFEGDRLEMIVDLFLLGLMTLTLPVVLIFKYEVMTYRLTLVLICLAIMAQVAIGSGQETILYWTLIIPLVVFFFLEKREGILLVALFSLGLLVLLVNGKWLGTYIYDLSTAGRFFTAFFFIVVVSYGLEASRYQAAQQVLAKNEELAVEKERLERALAEIKTLSGLLPICSSCKKVRADSGYWHQIEEYISEHSEARFTHGICPDCIERLYPNLAGEDD